MSEAWQRNVPVYDVPIVTKPLIAMLAFGAISLVLTLYREVVGLGTTSGMTDVYAWGIWKTISTMVLTGLGSGGFAIGIAAWVFNRQKLHAVLRTSVITSFLVYACGLTMLGIDVGRPWNFYWIMMPWKWNAHSPLLEVAFCMPLYTCVPLLFELVPAFLEWVHDTFPSYRAQIALADKIVRRAFPYLLALAFLLPAMHQSSLGALMLLAGNQVNPLWQTPFLPLLYVWAAAYMGFAFVMAVLLVAHLVWKRTIDMDVLSEMSRITVWITAAWMVFRFVDLGLRGSLMLAFAATLPAALFWMETALLLASILLLVRAVKEQSPKLVFVGSLIASLGGMLYRFDPTTLAFQPRPGSFYFPSAIELIINLGILSLGTAAFCVMVKLMAFLPASNEKYRAMEAARAKADETPLAKIKFALFASAD